MTLSENEIYWIREGERGTSSETIFETLSGNPLLEKHRRWETPRDPSDFRRCYELLQLIPEWRVRLPEVAKAHPHWSLIVDHWDELVDLLLNHSEDGMNPDLYRRLEELNKYRHAPEKFKERSK